jgi:hypothetical protein
MVINKNMDEKNIPDNNKTRATGIKESELPFKIGHYTS